jgi:flavin reductase (DIM6/NTAB) family NADH-FMN oxidoreductase RutF
MAKEPVAFDSYLRESTTALTRDGALLCARDPEGRPNAMTIGWGTVGIIWGKPVYQVLVRPSRYTYHCLEVSGDFTVNIPYADQAEQVLLCGTQSGREMDKFAACGFTAGQLEEVGSPYIEECGMVYACRIVQKNDVVPSHFVQDIIEGCYPSGDFHRIYFGEILATLADDDFRERFGPA